jgi:peptidoglycan hydrolase-like protein with peptidoglycan-binding domain
VYEDLAFGDVGDAVYRLQQALNRIGFYVAEEGAGAPGQETQTFGTSTQNALIRFQENFAINPVIGIFGPVTRALLGFILNW